MLALRTVLGVALILGKVKPVGVRPWFAGLMCLPLLALSGCSDDDAKADPDPTPSVTAQSPSESPTGPVEPQPPAAMDASDQAGAVAFVRYFWDVVSYAQVTGDTSRLRELGFDLCELCSGAVSDIEQIYGAGGYIKGGAFSVSRPRSTQLQRGEHSTYSVDFVLAAEKQVVLEKEGGERKHREGGNTKLRFLIGHDSRNEWRVSQWEFL